MLVTKIGVANQKHYNSLACYSMLQFSMSNPENYATVGGSELCQMGSNWFITSFMFR